MEAWSNWFLHIYLSTNGFIVTHYIVLPYFLDIVDDTFLRYSGLFFVQNSDCYFFYFDIVDVAANARWVIITANYKYYYRRNFLVENRLVPFMSQIQILLYLLYFLFYFYGISRVWYNLNRPILYLVKSLIISIRNNRATSIFVFFMSYTDYSYCHDDVLWMPIVIILINKSLMNLSMI